MQACMAPVSSASRIVPQPKKEKLIHVFTASLVRSRMVSIWTAYTQHNGNLSCLNLTDVKARYFPNIIAKGKDQSAILFRTIIIIMTPAFSLRGSARVCKKKKKHSNIFHESGKNPSELRQLMSFSKLF